MKKKYLTSNILKIIALISMLTDHMAITIFGIDDSNIIYCAMRFIGRIAFPIFVFLLVEGHRHTHSQVKYLLRLCAFYLISIVPYNLFEGNKPFYFSFHESQNIFLTLILCQLSLMLFDWVSGEKKTGILGYLSIVLVIALTIKVPIFMYSWIGVALAFAIYLTKIYKAPEYLVYILIALCFIPKYVYAAKSGSWIEWGVLLAIPIIFLYNGEKGKIKVNKYFYQYFFYAFYPLHLLILWAIKYFIF